LKNGILIFIIAALLILAVSCNKPADNDETQLPRDNIETPQNTGQDDSQKKHQDNLGESEADKNAVGDFTFPDNNVRPYAVMIDNEGSRVLPQGGLHLAQIIYEIIVEGGESRFMPVFWGTDPEMIGPVRSSRHYFIDYVMEHDAIYIHYGGSPMAYRDLSSLKINNIDGCGAGGGIFWDLTKDRNNWQDSYTLMEKITRYVNKAKFRTSSEKKPVFSYNNADVEPTGGKKANNIRFTYSNSNAGSFEYDEAAKTYKRFRKGKPHMERVSGKQLEAKNIIIQHVRNYGIKGDTAGRQEVNTVGSGDGWFITCGRAIKIKWSKDSRSSPTKYMDGRGNSIMLNPGQTWVQVVPLSSKVEIE
jgi:hypothetical protein